MEEDMAEPSGPPESLVLIEDFVNTNDAEAGTDELQSSDLLKAWLVDHRLLESSEDVDGSGRARVVEVREGLRALLVANAGDPLDRASVDGLNRVAGEVRMLVTFVPDGSARLAPGAAGVDGAIARVLGAVYTAMADGTWPRLKACLKDTCRWAYYDRSKNRSRRWCAMSVCGNVVKARAYRARHASEPAQA
jgi:predicted RNA-binding Zn ribbon-like protein